MTDTIIAIAGLIITLLGVPCALAFTFSQAYKKWLAYVLIAILFIMLLFVVTWSVGVWFADATLREHINVANARSALETVDFWKLSLRNLSIFVGVFIIASLIVFGLRYVDDLKEYEQMLKDQREAAAAQKRISASQEQLPSKEPSPSVVTRRTTGVPNEDSRAANIR